MSEDQTSAATHSNTQDAIRSAPGPKGLKADQLMSFSALMLSIFALAVALFEANTQRVQQRADIWPYVRIDQGFNQNGYYVQIANKGVGPALIEHLQIGYRGVEYTDLDSLIIAVVGEDNAFSYDLYRMSNPVNSVLSPGEALNLYQAPWEARTRLFAERFSAQGDFSVCYCSILEECWMFRRNEADDPSPVRTCPDYEDAS